MSIASLGIVGGLAGTALPQRAAETEKVQRETVERARAADATEKAARAGGIGETAEDAQTSDRDADGRRPWEQQVDESRPTIDALEQTPALPIAKDPSGARGTLLDLMG